MAIENTLISSTASPIYTSTGRTAITTVIVCNTSVYDPGDPTDGLDYLSLHLVKDGESAGDVNKIVNALPVPAGETVTFDQEKIILEDGDSVVAYSSVIENLVSTVSYLEV